MEKRYQVFVSSTYADLKSERQKVIQALMEMDCIPAVMELFPATDDEQWDFIRSVIDDCDYYLIIIGNRYGSMTAEGISYTEKEFDYAESKGMKIVALVHEDPDSLPVNKSDLDPSLREKLCGFREKVTSNRLVKFWKHANELPGMVVLSLSKTIKTYPAVGWVRASSVASEEMLIEINNLRKTNQNLEETLRANQPVPISAIENLAEIDSNIVLHGTTKTSYRMGSARIPWKSEVSWRKIFSLLAPYLIEHPEDRTVRRKLIESITDEANINGYDTKINDQEFKTVSIQLKALGLVKIDYLKTTNGNYALFWSLTSEGERLMMKERTVKKKEA